MNVLSVGKCSVTAERYLHGSFEHKLQTSFKLATKDQIWDVPATRTKPGIN